MAFPAPPSPSLFAKTYRRVKRHRPEPPAVQAASAPAPAEHSDEPSPAAGKAEPPPPPLVDLSALVRSKIAYYAEVDRTVLETMCLDEPPLGAQFAAEAEPDTGEDVLDAGDADAAAEGGRRKDRANLALAECSQKYNRLMGELREEGWGDSDSAA